MRDFLDLIDEKRLRLDRHRPFSAEFLKNMGEWFRIELTYTSNAIEGNTLTRQETALVVDKGMTVAGKTLVEHLEAVNHARAIDFVETLRTLERQTVTERMLLDIHAIILKGIDDAHAGSYRNVPVRIAGSRVAMPNPMKVPSLMREFFEWLQGDLKEHPARIAADAHFRWMSIHPFVDGNGRTARLLMNLLLLQAGYPPALIRKEDRLEYIQAIEKGQLGKGMNDYYEVIYKGVVQSLDEMLSLLEESEIIARPKLLPKLLKIGQLAQATGESVSTIRHWTKEELLTVAEKSAGGYQLYSPDMVKRIRKIRKLQKEKRLTLAELKQVLG